MPKIFRSIRQHFLSRHKLGRYLLYSIGEIVLVVIGILLALQINTWNEERVTRLREIKFLREIRSNLERNVEVFHNFESGQSRIVGNMNKLLEWRKSGIPFHDSLAPYFVGISWLEQVNLVKSAYETLKASGLELISSDSLRLKVVDLHEVFYAHQKELVKDVGLALLSTRVQKITTDYPELSDRYHSKDFSYFLEHRIIWKNDLRHDNTLLLSRTQDLIDAIDKELEDLTK